MKEKQICRGLEVKIVVKEQNDRIQAMNLLDKERQMFESNINPASGERDRRIQTENLVVLKRDK